MSGSVQPGWEEMKYGMSCWRPVPVTFRWESLANDSRLEEKESLLEEKESRLEEKESRLEEKESLLEERESRLEANAS